MQLGTHPSQTGRRSARRLFLPEPAQVRRGFSIRRLQPQRPLEVSPRGLDSAESPPSRTAIDVGGGILPTAFDGPSEHVLGLGKPLLFQKERAVVVA